MTQDQIAAWVDAVGAPLVSVSMGRGEAAMFSAAQLQHFAGLVAAAEREACARICDRNDMSAWGFARAIRARGGSV